MYVNKELVIKGQIRLQEVKITILLFYLGCSVKQISEFMTMLRLSIQNSESSLTPVFLYLYNNRVPYLFGI